MHEEIHKRTEENQRLKDEISSLHKRMAQLEKQLRKLDFDNEDLQSALQLALECQSELSLELIEFKDKHNELLIAFHDKQQECRELSKKYSHGEISSFSYNDSLAYELEQSLSSQVNQVNSNEDSPFKTSYPELSTMCVTPDSLLSAESYMTGFSPHNSFHPDISSDHQVHDSKSATPIPSTSNFYTSHSSMISSCHATTTTSSKTLSRGHPFANKLRYIKPLEGSQTLSQWKKLAMPDLNDLLADSTGSAVTKEKYISRIKANLAATKMKIDELILTNESVQVDKKISTRENFTETDSNRPFSVSSTEVKAVSTNTVNTLSSSPMSLCHNNMVQVTPSIDRVQSFSNTTYSSGLPLNGGLGWIRNSFNSSGTTPFSLLKPQVGFMFFAELD